MEGMRYTANLPSIRLTGSRLADLERILLAQTSEPEIKFELEDNFSTYEYSDGGEILQDPTLPPLYMISPSLSKVKKESLSLE